MSEDVTFCGVVDGQVRDALPLKLLSPMLLIVSPAHARRSSSKYANIFEPYAKPEGGSSFELVQHKSRKNG